MVIIINITPQMLPLFFFIQLSYSIAFWWLSNIKKQAEIYRWSIFVFFHWEREHLMLSNFILGWVQNHHELVMILESKASVWLVCLCSIKNHIPGCLWSESRLAPFMPRPSQKYMCQVKWKKFTIVICPEGTWQSTSTAGLTWFYMPLRPR